MSTTDHSTRTEDLAADLRSASERVAELEARVEEVGESRLDRVADAFRGAERLLDRWEERATDYDDFEGYVEFQNTFVEFVESLPADLPHREAFEDADDRFQKSRLTAEDFDAARDLLEPAREDAELLDRYREARKRFGELRHETRERVRELDARVGSLERLVALDATDLDVPVSDLHDPIEAYNDHVTEAFETFRRERPAREVLSLVADAAGTPFVGFRSPPTRLAEYVESAEVGEEPIPTLLEYADYSASKLSHYVDAPHELQRHVATNRTYLNGLDASPLTVDWPPPPASKLRYQTREYQRVLARFAPEETVARLREVRELTRDAARYGDLREAAYTLSELDAEDRERLDSGAVERDLREVRAERRRLREALDEVA